MAIRNSLMATMVMASRNSSFPATTSMPNSRSNKRQPLLRLPHRNPHRLHPKGCPLTCRVSLGLEVFRPK